MPLCPVQVLALIIIKCFMPKSNLSRIKTGLRFGIAFGLMYMAGMQEVVVASSPFETYGWGFVAYQFFMGLGDAIPVIILCLLVTCIDKNNPPGEMLKVKHNTKANIVIVSIIAIAFVVERIIGYLVGYVDSDIDKFPVPVVVWTVVFGVVLGGMYLIIRPIYNNKNNTKRTMQIMEIGRAHV